MFKPTWTAVGMALACGLLPAAHAAGDEEVERLRADFARQLQTLQADYDARLKAVEQRAAPAAAPSAANAFNPALSLILQGGYVDAQAGTRRPTGYLQDAEIGAPTRGFAINGAELLLSANVDPYLRGSATLVVGADGRTSVEEAWGQTLGLDHGLTLKGGRFISGVGYQNEQHPHAWDFNDNNLMYQVLFGEHLVQDGVQLKWLAPTDTYVELGTELGSGAAFPGSSVDRNGVGGWSVFGHVGGDLDESNSWRAGVSYLAARPVGRASTVVDLAGNAADTRFSGTSATWMLDFVWKWAPQGNVTERNFKLQAEAFEREESGALTYDPGATNATAPYDARQRGWYAQAIYQFMPRWRVGLRHDQLEPGEQRYGSNSAYLAASDYRPRKLSLMTDYAPSEFSRFRLQLTQDHSMQGNPDDRVISLQYVYSLGPHGAHQF